MDRVPPGFLQPGDNRLPIRRADSDDFTVFNAAVHWRREGEPASV